MSQPNKVAPDADSLSLGASAAPNPQPQLQPPIPPPQQQQHVQVYQPVQVFQPVQQQVGYTITVAQPGLPQFSTQYVTHMAPAAFAVAAPVYQQAPMFQSPLPHPGECWCCGQRRLHAGHW